MKIAKFSSKTAGDALAQAGGAVAGMLLSNGASEAIPLDNQTARRGITLAVGLATVVLVGGSDTGAKIARSVGAGIAAQQAKELIKEAASPHIPNKKFLNDMFEKPTIKPTAPEGVAAALAAARRRRGLANPTFQLGNRAPVEVNNTLFQAG